MRRLDAYNYPEREADLTGVIERGPHRIRWAVSGNPDGLPVISILGDDAEMASDAARRLHDYEQVLMHLHPPTTSGGGYDPEVFSRVMAHYMVHDCFLEPNQLIDNASRLADIPVVIRQGRFDMCTPPSTAFAFQAAVPHADLRIVENASHMPTEHNLLREIVRAGDELHDLLTR